MKHDVPVIDRTGVFKFTGQFLKKKIYLLSNSVNVYLWTNLVGNTDLFTGGFSRIFNFCFCENFRFS